MAHFAKINEDNKVIGVLTLNDSDMLNADGVEDESVGQQYLEKHNNWPAHLWIQTSYNTREGKHYDSDNNESEDQSKAFRGNYAAVGFTWDPDNNLFWPRQPYPSWTKNMSNIQWECPAGDPPVLTDEEVEQRSYYSWNEENQSWDLTNI
tara:strand:- start:534 stop:983 length:450 start_codon:yes stop_codon:yes gene_type:complete